MARGIHPNRFSPFQVWKDTHFNPCKFSYYPAKNPRTQRFYGFIVLRGSALIIKKPQVGWCKCDANRTCSGSFAVLTPNVAKTPYWQTSFVRGRDNIETPLGGASCCRGGWGWCSSIKNRKTPGRVPAATGCCLVKCLSVVPVRICESSVKEALQWGAHLWHVERNKNAPMSHAKLIFKSRKCWLP